MEVSKAQQFLINDSLATEDAIVHCFRRELPTRRSVYFKTVENPLVCRQFPIESILGVF